MKKTSKNIRLALVGVSGRMGQEIYGLANDSKKFLVTSGVGKSQAELEPAHYVKSISELDPKKVDVVIDFSQPELFAEVMSWCSKHKISVVSGTTGLSSADEKALRAASGRTAVLWAANMSMGVTLVSEMLRLLAKYEDAEFQIEELHHKRKKDSPSGTALFLQKTLQAERKEKLPAPLSIRGGGIFGIHRVWAMAEEETITIEHTAMNRKVFARGALQAAEWLAGRKPGLYRMANVFA
jgi:4-hydroxy-tetrahydrodipicolinate reductase